MKRLFSRYFNSAEKVNPPKVLMFISAGQDGSVLFSGVVRNID